ncbi:Os07g0614600 [Oryza sativa Japonica Group]|uniref:Os07g0614600 protein n=1 Tax=Oryza sativa subsp. japonica TaxID=39947 RepID=Q0D4P4_ORYSJ|nr:Os07g0614600 [Oryza sativa Japonica Group]|eukprot:NP_001060265.2 Os07g0614600 [Oryza sativa Japonica Group]
MYEKNSKIKIQVHFKTTDEHNERWRVAWVIPAVWELISFFLLCTICILWTPSQNSMRYMLLLLTITTAHHLISI